MVKEEAKNANAHAPAETACATRGETSVGRVSGGDIIGELVRKAVECLEESEERRWERNNNASWAEHDAEEASKRSMADLSAAVTEVSERAFGVIDRGSVEAACMDLVEDRIRHNIENVSEADAAWAYQIEADVTAELSYGEICERLRDAAPTTHVKGAAATDGEKVAWFPEGWLPEGYDEVLDEGGVGAVWQEYGEDFACNEFGLPNFLGDALVASAELGGSR